MEVIERTLSGRNDLQLLFLTRAIRMFGYGLVSVVLVLYLTALAWSAAEIGLLLALTLLGDAAVSLWLTTHADRIGRRRVLIIGSVLMLAAGLVFVATPVYLVVLAAATIGVISPSGNEVGPFLAVEQASLSQIVGDRRRTSIFARYQLTGSFATAAGALVGGGLAQLAIDAGASAAEAYRLVIIGYALGGVLLAILFSRASARIEVPKEEVTDVAIRTRLGLHRSQRVVLRLSALFALDAFAGGFVIARASSPTGSATASGWTPRRWARLIFGANILAGLSALAGRPARARFGLVRTMVFTHLPSNVLLILVPFMPTLPLAVAVLLRPVQHQPDGRADPPVLHDRGRRPRTSAPPRPGSPELPGAWARPRRRSSRRRSIARRLSPGRPS